MSRLIQYVCGPSHAQRMRQHKEHRDKLNELKGRILADMQEIHARNREVCASDEPACIKEAVVMNGLSELEKKTEQYTLYCALSSHWEQSYMNLEVASILELVSLQKPQNVDEHLEKVDAFREQQFNVAEITQAHSELIQQSSTDWSKAMPSIPEHLKQQAKEFVAQQKPRRHRNKRVTEHPKRVKMKL